MYNTFIFHDNHNKFYWMYLEAILSIISFSHKARKEVQPKLYSFDELSFHQQHCNKSIPQKVFPQSGTDHKPMDKNRHYK